MLYFIVTVHPQRVQVDEHSSELRTYDYSAVVDGVTWRYRIKYHNNLSKNDKHPRERAVHHINYHAHNSGTHVRFEPTYTRVRSTRKISDKQLSFW